MSLFVFSAWGAPMAGPVKEGDTLTFTFEVPRFGSVQDAPVTNVSATLYRVRTAGDHVLLSNLTVVEVGKTFEASWVVPSGSAPGDYVVHWNARVPGRPDLPTTIDRFRVGRLPATDGDVEYGKVMRP